MLPEHSQDIWQNSHRRRINKSYHESTDLTFVSALGGSDRVLRLVQRAACLVEKHLSRIGKLHASLRAMKEWHTQLGFQLSDLVAEGWLRDAQPRGRSGVPRQPQ